MVILCSLLPGLFCPIINLLKKLLPRHPVFCRGYVWMTTWKLVMFHVMLDVQQTLAGSLLLTSCRCVWYQEYYRCKDLDREQNAGILMNWQTKVILWLSSNFDCLQVKRKDIFEKYPHTFLLNLKWNVYNSNVFRVNTQLTLKTTAG